jgi:hypothetical protein
VKCEMVRKNEADLTPCVFTVELVEILEVVDSSLMIEVSECEFINNAKRVLTPEMIEWSKTKIPIIRISAREEDF